MYLLFFVMWVIFNGMLTLEIALFGIAISAVMFLFVCRFMDYSIQKDIFYIKVSGQFICFCLVLMKEIIKANFATIRLLISSKYEIEPVLVKFQSPVKTKIAKVLLANSITITPGTITVSVEEDEFVVHCLDVDFSEGLDTSILVKRLQRMEEPVVSGKVCFQSKNFLLRRGGKSGE